MPCLTKIIWDEPGRTVLVALAEYKGVEVCVNIAGLTKIQFIQKVKDAFVEATAPPSPPPAVLPVPFKELVGQEI